LLGNEMNVSVGMCKRAAGCGGLVSVRLKEEAVFASVVGSIAGLNWGIFRNTPRSDTPIGIETSRQLNRSIELYRIIDQITVLNIQPTSQLLIFAPGADLRASGADRRGISAPTNNVPFVGSHNG
jgi:hypothetical protein